jgi:hypothetical protein
MDAASLDGNDPFYLRASAGDLLRHLIDDCEKRVDRTPESIRSDLRTFKVQREPRC